MRGRRRQSDTADHPGPTGFGPLFDEDEPDADTGFDRRDFAPPGTMFPLQSPQATGRGRRRAGNAGSREATPRWVRYVLVAGGALLVVGILGMLLVPRQAAEDPRPETLAATDRQPEAPTAPAALADRPTEASSTREPTTDLGPTGSTDVPEIGSAQAIAMQFAHSYLNYDSEMPEVRARELSRYLAPGLDPQLGWSGTGRQLAALTVATDSRRDESGVVTVTVAAQVTGAQAPRWVFMDVRLDQDSAGAWAVVAAPAFVARPSPGTPDLPAQEAVDPLLSAALTEPLSRFFTAYGADRMIQVDGVTAEANQISGLDGQFVFVSLTELRVHTGSDDRRTAEAIVVWDNEVSGGTVAQSYTLELISQGGTWLVDAINTG